MSKAYLIIATITCGSIITIVGYFLFWKKKSKKKLNSSIDGDRKKEDDKQSVPPTKENLRYSNCNTTNLENTTASSDKRNQFCVTQQVEICFEKINTKEEIVINNEHERKISQESLGRKSRIEIIIPEEEASDSEKNYNKQKTRIPTVRASKNGNKEFEKDEYNHLRKKSSNYRENQNIDMNFTMLSIANDLKIIENINKGVKRYQVQNEDNELNSLNNTRNEIEKGYVSEDDDELDFDTPYLPEEMGTSFQFGDFSQIMEGDLRSSLIKKFSLDGKISTVDELNQILFNRENSNTKFPSGLNFNIQTELKTANDKQIEIIKAELLLVILKYLYTELHSGLIELSDNFVEQRRFYFEKDMDTYVSIINFFLRKKEEFFLGVLSTIMSRLNISQVLLDDTFLFYNNWADQDDELVKQIKLDYDKVYRAGIKTTIAPKNLTQNKLKEILEFQCEKYAELSKEIENMDVVEVIVIDYTYLEFGLDREAIKAAQKKHNIHELPDFAPYLQRLEEYQKDAFLNI